jgi:hypothetical protein
MSGLTHPYHCSHSPSSLFLLTLITAFTHPDDDDDDDIDDEHEYDDNTVSYSGDDSSACRDKYYCAAALARGDDSSACRSYDTHSSIYLSSLSLSSSACLSSSSLPSSFYHQ